MPEPPPLELAGPLLLALALAVFQARGAIEASGQQVDREPCAE
jgi:hypothetical protein